MLLYILPKPNINIYKYINIEITEIKPESYISNSLSLYLNEIKSQINIYENKWDKYKKYTNEYEFIHTSIPNKKCCVSKYKPISRSYFKMIELIHTFQFNMGVKTPIKTFHLAEGPGGFIEACINIRKSKCKDICKEDKYYGMTLVTPSNNTNTNTKTNNNNNNEIPGWKRGEHFLKQNKNVHIELGFDKTGNILSLNNFLHINDTYASSMDFITADGGFDFSSDFNNQEMTVSKLVYGQISYALCMQKQGGCFVLKIFDCFLFQTIDMLLLLASLYEEVYITKPYTSRSANSEKYIVCKGFIHSSFHYFSYLYCSFKKILETPTHLYINRILKDYEIPLYFLKKIEKYNGVYGQLQLENIQTTLDLIIKNEYNDNNNNRQYYHNSSKSSLSYTINTMTRDNIEKCIEWCIKVNIPIEPCLISNNYSSKRTTYYCRNFTTP